MPKLVPPSGPTTAKLVFIGEAPGADEELQGTPFVGASGKLLNAILARVGINRHECYFTNVVRVRPPSNNFEVFYADGPAKTTPSPLLRESIANLHNELRGLRPTVIIPLGGEALRALTSKRSIDSWRGSILPNPFGPGKIIGTYHPARVLREYSLLPIFTQDLKRVEAERADYALNLPEHQLELNPSYQRVIEYLKWLLANPRPFSFDIETTKNHVRCLGIADSALHAICIPFMSFSRSTPSATSIFLGPTGGPQVNSHWSEEEEYEILRLLDALFRSPTHPKYAQNFPFDATILGRDFGFQVSGLHLDTMVAAHTMYCELPKGLDFLASLYTRTPYYSDYDVSVDDETWRYNCLDCCVTFEIAENLTNDLRKRNFSNQVQSTNVPFSSYDFQSNHIQPAMQVMTRIGRRGVLQDLTVRDELKVLYAGQMVPLLAEFQALAGGPVNPASSPQMQELLYVELGMPVQHNHKTKKPTVDEPAIEKLMKKFPEHSRMFTVMLDWKERQKLVSTYLDCALRDNRLLALFNAVGTVNGRCNSAADYFGFGTNLQNIPVKSELGRVLRRMFIADPGYTLVKVDLSQAQFRMIVWFGKIRRLIDEYCRNPNFDVHRWLAGLIFKKAESAIVKSERDIAKNGVYGGGFGMMPTKAAQVYKLSVEDATFVLGETRRVIPEIPMWWQSIQATLNTTRTLINPFGRVRVFHDRLDDSAYREAYAAICQMTEADLIHRAITLCELLLVDCFPVLQVHDEIVLLCKTTALNRNLPIIKRIMEYPLPVAGVPEPLTIPCDIAYGPNWLDTTKWKGEVI